MLRRRNTEPWIRWMMASAELLESALGLQACRGRVLLERDRKGWRRIRERTASGKAFGSQPKHPQQAQQHEPPQQPLALGSWAARSRGASDGRDGSMITYSR